jgi:hypothetical protein
LLDDEDRTLYQEFLTHGCEVELVRWESFSNPKIARGKGSPVSSGVVRTEPQSALSASKSASSPVQKFKKLQVSFYLPNAPIMKMILSPNEKVLDIKYRFCALAGVQPEKIVLVYAGQILEENEFSSRYNITNQAMIIARYIDDMIENDE